MGIKNLNRLLIQRTSAIQLKNIDNIDNIRKIAFDGNLILHKIISASVSRTDLQNTHVNLIYKVLNLLEAKITPIFVFDGKPLPIKGDELSKRQEKRDNASVAYDKCIENGASKCEIDKYKKRMIRVELREVEDSQKLLNLLGIPNFIAPSEGEMLMALMSKKGLVDAVYTEDMDALPFGSKILIRNFNLKREEKRKVANGMNNKTERVERIGFDVISLDVVLKDLDLDMNSFIDLCILMGCDYVETLPGIGMVKAYMNISKYKTIEGVLENLKCDLPCEDWLNKVNLARDTFKSKIKFDLKFDFYDPQKIQLEPLTTFLSEMGFSEKRITNIEERVKKIIKTSNDFVGSKDLTPRKKIIKL